MTNPDSRKEKSFNPLDTALSMRGKNTVKMVEDAVAGGDAVLAYQPVVLARNPTKQAFFEGLIRILDRTGREIPAREFISEVEMHPIGRQIDCIALELGLMELKRRPDLRLSINLSARSIGFANWQKVLDDGLKRDPEIAQRLILEINEASTIAMPDVVLPFMQSLQARGVSFALDDFGAEVTSFSHLRDMYFDFIKIHGRFIRGVSQNPDNRELIRAMVAVGTHLDMLSVAVSVENEADALTLQNLGVECLQGYFFGAPCRRVDQTGQKRQFAAG